MHVSITCYLSASFAVRDYICFYNWNSDSPQFIPFILFPLNVILSLSIDSFVNAVHWHCCIGTSGIFSIWSSSKWHQALLSDAKGGNNIASYVSPTSIFYWTVDWVVKIVQASYTVGGQSFSAAEIEFVILKMKTPMHRPQLVQLISPPHFLSFGFLETCYWPLIFFFSLWCWLLISSRLRKSTRNIQLMKLNPFCCLHSAVGCSLHLL